MNESTNPEALSDGLGAVVWRCLEVAKDGRWLPGTIELQMVQALAGQRNEIDRLRRLICDLYDQLDNFDAQEHYREQIAVLQSNAGGKPTFGQAATPGPRVVVRIRTTAWSDRRGLYAKKALTFMRRQCEGHNYVKEDLSAIGADKTIGLITNIDVCPDGLYEIAICNETTDWETGYVDGYEYELRPIAPLNTY